MMLSTISHSMSPSSALSHHVDAPSNMTTSLPILPQRQPALSQGPRSLPARPKLQINTQQVRTFGKGSTSLRLDTLSAISPTVRNTFSNAYEPASAAGRKPRLSIDSNLNTESSNPLTVSTPNSASTLSSTLTSASSTESATIKIPYKQPHNLTSILSNSPARNLIPRKMAPVRPFFPAEKKVSFRTPLEEEIKTSRYTMAHSEIHDLESSVSSGSTVASIEISTPSESESSSGSLPIATSSSESSSDIPSSPSVASPSEQSNSSTFSSLETSPRPRGPRAGDKRDSSESDSDSAPETPVAGRRKRTRDWRWTLGPLPSDKSSSSASTSDTTTTDEDSS